MKKEKMILKWDRKENDWMVHYPNRNGKIIGGIFCRMITDFEERMRKDWEARPMPIKSFKDFLEGAGYDSNTFTISITKNPTPDA